MLFVFFNDPATTEIYTLSLHDALPIYRAILRVIPSSNGTVGRVVFRGKISHDEVLSEMRAHDAVLVPSRREYPEGLPMTIYEAPCTRTPVAASDHPMFLKRIVADSNGLAFRSADSASISDAA